MNVKDLAIKIANGNCKSWEIENFFLEYTKSIREDNDRLKRELKGVRTLYREQVKLIIEKDEIINKLKSEIKK